MGFFSFFLAVLNDNKALGESGGLDDDESDIGLFSVLIGARDSASSRLFWVAGINLVLSGSSVQSDLFRMGVSRVGLMEGFIF